LLPVSFAYAILRHRLFDITVMVRQGLQYALARRLLLSIAPAMVTVLLVDLWISRHASLAGILLERGWLYLALAGLALVAGLRRGHWLAALDRRFFRDQYNAHRTLRGVTEEIRASDRFDAMAPRVVGWVAGALHVDFVSLLVRCGGERVYQPVATRPDGADVPVLCADDRTVRLLHLLQTPIQVPSHDGHRLVRQLPREELETLRRSGIELLVPVGSGDGAPAALLALGPKRSEEPYSAEDEDLLVTLADSLALLFSRTHVSDLLADTTEVCPVCGVCYDAGTRACPSDDAALSALLLPRSLGGRYRLTRRVGRGGMGTVYSATDTALDRPVAIKVLHEELASDGDLMARLQTEAQLLAGFVHPNIVTIHDLGVTASRRGFLVMELLDGVTLREELRRTGPMPLPRVLHILRGVGAAIDAAHVRQIVHRDLKPENIRLCPGQTGEIPKVLDFGVARALETRPGAPITAAGMVAGTPPYMAPEHLRGAEASPDWDLWAFATIAFELIADGLPATMAADADRFDAVPAGLHPLFSRALSAHPINRPTSAAELVDELDRLLAQP
jgi:serine/threonine-protein kinase